MSYTRVGESGRYIWCGGNYANFGIEVVVDEDIDVFLYKLFKTRPDEFWQRYHHGSRIIENYSGKKIGVYRYDRSTEDKMPVATVISEIAGEIWRDHFTPIIGEAQVEYMLDKFQSAEQICTDMDKNNFIYFIAKCEKSHSEGTPLGYCAVVPRDDHLFLSKMYVKNEHRGRGIAHSFLAEADALCRLEYGLNKIRLVVNKHNSGVIAAYQKMGFEIVDAVKADIGGGFFMDDYVMERYMTWPKSKEDEYAQKPTP